MNIWNIFEFSIYIYLRVFTAGKLNTFHWTGMRIMKSECNSEMPNAFFNPLTFVPVSYPDSKEVLFFSKFWVIDLSMKCRVSNLCIFRVPLIPLMINLEPSLKPFKRNTFPTHASDITAILYCFCFDSIDNICKWKRSLEPCPIALCEISCGKKVTTNVLLKKRIVKFYPRID